MCCWNINGNGKRGSEFICLSCLEWKTVFTRDIQRSNQREPFHVKNNTCLHCGEVIGNTADWTPNYCYECGKPLSGGNGKCK